MFGPLNLSLLLSRASCSSRELARHHHHQQGKTSCHIFGSIEGAIALFLFSPQSFLKHTLDKEPTAVLVIWRGEEEDKYVVCGVEKTKIVVRCEVLLIDIIVHLGALHEAE